MVMLSIGEATSSCSLSEEVSHLLNLDGACNIYKQVKDLSLKSRSIAVAAANFDKSPFPLEKLQPDTAKNIAELLPTSLDVLVCVNYIQNENYWKKIIAKKNELSSCRIEEHGLTWKRLYLEQYLQQLLEFFDSEKNDVNSLLSTISTFGNYIFTLKFRQLPSHIMLDKVFKLLPNITNVDIQYGALYLNMNYDPEEFGMKLSDTTGLGRGIRSLQNLTSLILNSNQINDDILRILLKGMGDSFLNMVMHLDVSHNKITTNGFRLLANKVLDPDSVLQSLNISDNRIHAEGGRCLGRLLRSNKSLTHLNVKLNKFEDAGGRMILDGVRDNTTLVNVNISSNGLGSESAAALAAALGDYSPQKQLSSLDLSCNRFNNDDIALLQMAMERNTTIHCIDLRMNPFDSSPNNNINNKVAVLCLSNELRRNKSLMVKNKCENVNSSNNLNSGMNNYPECGNRNGEFKFNLL